ncbi:MAG TPA: SPFH domain-containing protein [Planctomycetota bacterium]|nr:SPFH domain-containing protein [Planctomycetota bacterium]
MPADRRNEKPIDPLSGWPVLLGLLLWEALLLVAMVQLATTGREWAPVLLIPMVLGLVFTLPGFYLVNPNTSRVLVLFGTYRGTVRREGFWFTNPFTIKHKVSLKAHNVASQKIKVNDSLGNPIEIGAVVVWQVRDTAQAMFEVEKYEEYVDIQIESAVRQLASRHPYDDLQAEGGELTLRGDTEEVTAELERMLGERLDRAGIAALEARISHLAYAPEIASAMLQRQQAQAVIAARRQIVEGAVSMVEHALEDLGKRHVVELDMERRATLVGNLLVVLCGQTAPQPVLNTGSLYN